MRILLLGGGYVLSRLAEQLDTQQFVISSRSTDKIKEFRSKGWEAVSLDISHKNSTKDFFTEQPAFDLIIDSVPPFHSAESSMSQKTLGVKNVISALVDLNKIPSRLFYLSTTGVYGKENGEIVNENSTTTPLSARGEARLASEKLYSEVAAKSDCQLTCFRIAAISGPERNPVSSIKAGRYPLIEDGARYTNRIHVEDLVRVLYQAINYKEILPSAINCSSGKSYPAIQMLEYLAAKYDLDLPESVSLEEIKARGWGTMLSNQQVSNKLLVDLFPDAIQFSDLTWM